MATNIWIKAFVIQVTEIFSKPTIWVFYQQVFFKDRQVAWHIEGRAGESQYMKALNKM